MPSIAPKCFFPPFQDSIKNHWFFLFVFTWKYPIFTILVLFVFLTALTILNVLGQSFILVVVTVLIERLTIWICLICPAIYFRLNTEMFNVNGIMESLKRHKKHFSDFSRLMSTRFLYWKPFCFARSVSGWTLKPYSMCFIATKGSACLPAHSTRMMRAQENSWLYLHTLAIPEATLKISMVVNSVKKT